MSLNAAMIQTMVDKGLSGQDIADIAKAGEVKHDHTAAERQARHRAKSRERRNAVTSRRDPPNDTLTPGVSPDGEPQLAGCDVFPRPTWADEVVWADFMGNRKAKKARNTATAYADFLADIERIADDEWPPPRLLKHAAAKGWKGIYDPRSRTNDKPTASNDEYANPIVRAVARRQAARPGAEFG